MFSVAVVDMAPGLFHAFYFCSVVKVFEKGFFKFFGSRARNHTSDVHVRVAGAGETEINDADDFVIFIQEDITEVEIAVNKFFHFGFFNVVMVGVNMFIVMFIV